MRRLALVLAWALGVYLVVRAIAEPFLIDMTDPATYRDDWGGPSLIGVLAVHMLPGLVAAVLIIRSVQGRRNEARARVRR